MAVYNESYHIDSPIKYKSSKVTSRNDAIYSAMCFGIMLFLASTVELDAYSFLPLLGLLAIFLLLFIYYIFNLIRHHNLMLTIGPNQFETKGLLIENRDFVCDSVFSVSFKQRMNIYDWYSIVMTIKDSNGKKVLRKMPISYFDYKAIKTYFENMCPNGEVIEVNQIRGGNKE